MERDPKLDIFEQLESEFQQNAGKEQANQLTAFARRVFDLLPAEEYANSSLKDLAGFITSFWDFFSNYKDDGPKIRIFNPTLEEDGWLSPHTVVFINQTDMPFMVDSLRIQLNQRGLNIHSNKSTLFNLIRDDNGDIMRIAGAGEGVFEALMFFQVDLHSSQSEIQELHQCLEEALADVNAVVDDFEAMRGRVEQVIEEVSGFKAGIPIDERDESVAFLKWIHSGYYTFLGSSEYRLIEEDGQRVLVEDADCRMGLFRRRGGEAGRASLDSLNAGMRDFYDQQERLLAFTYSSARSRVHRHVHADYIIIKRLNKKGEPIGELRLLGLFTSPVYTLSPTVIPILRKKVQQVFERSGLRPDSHDGKGVRQLLEVHPRPELFQSSVEQLYKTILGVWQLNERRKVRYFVRIDPYEKFVNCMVYVPRDLYNTGVRERVEKLLVESYGAVESEFFTYLSESILARIQFVLRIDSDQYKSVDPNLIEQQIVQITRNWSDEVQHCCIEHWGEDDGPRLFRKYGRGFPTSYQENFDPRTTMGDIELMESLKGDSKLAMHFYQPLSAAKDVMRFKVFHREQPLELSSMVPMLENLGFRVQGEHPYMITLNDGQRIYLSDFTLNFSLAIDVDVPAVRKNFKDAFRAIWNGRADNDSFNRLVVGARLDWRSVAMLRMYSRYMKQLGFNLSQEFIADTLAKNLEVTRNLVALFKSLFDPRYEQDGRADRLTRKITRQLDEVANLNEDKVMRTCLNLINATLRTNFFQTDANGRVKPYISLKLSPKDLSEAPKPRPAYEIFVYSPRMEGVHLRGGKVARGGLRWSDRMEDYRTEVLGLVKAQQVKNAVIVPTGSKGCFVAKKLHETNSRETFLAEGIACYKLFIRGLLDVTDNIVAGEVVPPKDVVRRDDDDPYLVVAADKGTATFSDIANEISDEYGHWLGDAFASGGSNGYDHKGMGITARGAWVAVQRHFREKGINTQTDEFTVIGIGDMGGDVFGNGMLLSDKIRLQVAFNHLHIFIDPNPNAAATFDERKRLFETPGTSWADFNPELISKGGGVFERSAKSIKLTPEIRKAFGIEATDLSPAEFIHELLKAEVDLIWNGGIGTYVKASDETHDQVGDRANDSLRVDGDQLRCKVFGEGGNLGLTQRGRIEYCRNGGACNTDFIDNAGGVDCSDHEVNMKILLNELVANQDLTVKQRNLLLEEMTDDVADLVLENNYRQTGAISVAEYHCATNFSEYCRLIVTLENAGKLDRALEFLPDDETLADRDGRGEGLYRPEISTLISYSKVGLKNALIKSKVADDAYMARAVETLFPVRMRNDYPEQIHNHSLRREIIATQLANELVNTMGLTFYMRQMESTGANAEEVLKAYVIVRDLFNFRDVWENVESLDYQISSELQNRLFTCYMRLGRRATRWVLRNWRTNLDPAKVIPQYQPVLHEAEVLISQIMVGEHGELWHKDYQELTAVGVSKQAASLAASANSLFYTMGVAEIAQTTETPIEYALRLYHLLGHHLSLDWFGDQLVSLRPETRWKDFARESFVDELESHRRSLTQAVLLEYGKEAEIDSVIVDWSGKHTKLVKRWLDTVQELRSATTQDFAMYSVALRELQDLSRATGGIREV